MPETPDGGWFLDDVELERDVYGRTVLAEYSPDQPRAPKGDPRGGQWSDAGGGGTAEKASGSQDVGQPYQGYDVARRLADQYVASQGREYKPLAPLLELNPERIAQVADAYKTMVHAPNDPDVAAAYKALADETLAQYQVLKENGLRVEPAPEGGEPYHGAVDVARDVREHNHMYYYPTTAGFGSSEFDARDNPLLADSGERDGSGRRMLVNDVFRVVHDYFGHVKDGNTFRPLGEENAWRSHMAMYSPLAAKAMTSEARGQNAWVYYGPYGEANRAAKDGSAVHFADQKTGIMEAQALREARDRRRRRRIPGGILHARHWEPPTELQEGNPEFDPDQSRDERGRWVSDGGGGSVATEQALLDRLRAPDGGFTYSPTTNVEPTRGYAVSAYPDRSKVFGSADALSEDDLLHYVVTNWDVLSLSDHYLGAWHDPKTGKVYLDVSVVKNDEAEAKALALAKDQIAYFDLVNMKSIDVNREAKSGQGSR